MEDGPLFTPSLSHFFLEEVDIFGLKKGRMQKTGDKTQKTGGKKMVSLLFYEEIIELIAIGSF
jgi:hypothetical protein